MAFTYPQLSPGVSSLPSHRICVEPESENTNSREKKMNTNTSCLSYPLRYTTSKHFAIYMHLGNGISMDLLPYFSQLYAFKVLRIYTNASGKQGRC